MVTVAFPPRLVAMETAAPCPSSSPLLTFRSPAFSVRLLARSADSLALAKFRPPRSRAPIFSPTTTTMTTTTTTTTTTTDGELALAPSFLRRESSERGKAKERNTQEETGRKHVHMRDSWRSSATSRLLRNSSIAYQPRVTRNPVMRSRAMLIRDVQEDPVDASRCRGCWTPDPAPIRREKGT